MGGEPFDDLGAHRMHIGNQSVVDGGGQRVIGEVDLGGQHAPLLTTSSLILALLKQAQPATRALATVPTMKVAHIILRVTALDESIAFYRDRVALELTSESPGFAFFDGGSITVTLNANPSEPADITNTEVVLEVDDVAATYREMSDRGVPFEVELRPVMEQEGRALHAAHFRDPDGHLWSVTGWV